MIKKLTQTLALCFAAATGLGCASAAAPRNFKPTPPHAVCSGMTYSIDTLNCLRSVSYDDMLLMPTETMLAAFRDSEIPAVQQIYTMAKSQGCLDMEFTRNIWMNIQPPGSVIPIRGQLTATIAQYFNNAARCHQDVGQAMRRHAPTKELGAAAITRSGLDLRLAYYYSRRI